jgi:hypothetical protein
MYRCVKGKAVMLIIGNEIFYPDSDHRYKNRATLYLLQVLCLFYCAKNKG